MKSQNAYTHRETCMEIHNHVCSSVFVGTDSEAHVSGSWLTEFGMCTIRVCTQMYFANHAYTQGICNVNVFYSVN